MRLLGLIVALLSPLGAVSASAADADLICPHSSDFESIAHVKISGSKALIRYVNLRDEKNKELDYTYKAASDATVEYELRESDRYYYWYDLAESQKYFREPESITLDGLMQSFFNATARAEAYEKETNDLGIFVISGNMIVIDRAIPTLYVAFEVRTGGEPIGETQERPCEIIEADDAIELMENKLSEFKEIEAESIKTQEEGLKSKF